LIVWCVRAYVYVCACVSVWMCVCVCICVCVCVVFYQSIETRERKRKGVWLWAHPTICHSEFYHDNNHWFFVAINLRQNEAATAAASIVLRDHNPQNTSFFFKLITWIYPWGGRFLCELSANRYHFLEKDFLGKIIHHSIKLWLGFPELIRLLCNNLQDFCYFHWFEHHSLH